MNVAGYGQDVKYIGLDALQRASEVEDARIQMYNEMRQQDQQARSQAIGGLAGTAVGLGAGLYAKRKKEHDAENAQTLEKWKNEAFDQKLRNVRDHKDINADLKPEPTLTDYSAWDDLMKGLRDQGWVD